MSSVIARLLPVTIADAVLPLWIIMTLILLRGEAGLLKAGAFIAGAMTVRALQFVLFSRVFGAIVSAEGKDVFDLIPATLLLLTGILLLITAVKMWWWGKENDPDAPPPKWITALDRVSAPRAFGMGVVMMAVALKHWVFTLSAIAIIDEGNLSRIGSVLAYLFFVIGAHSLMLAPIISSAVTPEHSAKTVETMLCWLERRKRVITIVVSLAFGAWFIARGMRGFVAHGDTAKTPAI
jgi:hypothetical protein